MIQQIFVPLQNEQTLNYRAAIAATFAPTIGLHRRDRAQGAAFVLTGPLNFGPTSVWGEIG